MVREMSKHQFVTW